MKEATYTLHEPISPETLRQIDSLPGYRLEGNRLTVPYDPDAPCSVCGLPVIEASVGGTAVCPWCDTGRYRDACEWSYRATAKGLEPRFPHSHPAYSDPAPSLKEGDA